MTSNLNQKIVIQTSTASEIGGGCYTNSWVTLSSTSSAKLWASVSISKRLEDWQKEKAQQYNFYDVIIRKGINVAKGDRILYGSSILTIETIADLSQKQRMVKIVAREEVGS